MPETASKPGTLDLPNHAACLSCGYALRGLTEPKCPECGKAFDPARPETYIRAGQRGAFRLWLERGPGWVIAAGVFITTLVVLYSYSVPGGYFGWQMIGGLGVIIFGPLWAIRMLIALFANGFSGRLGMHLKDRWLVWALPAAIALGGMVLLELGAPSYARFFIARPGLAKAARQVQQGQTIPAPFHAGGTRFSTVDPIGQSGVVFIVAGSGFLAPGGWAYLPDPADQQAVQSNHLDGYYLYHLEGDWYRAITDY